MDQEVDQLTTFLAAELRTVPDGSIWKGDLSTGEGEVVLSDAGGPALGLDYDRRSGYLYVAGSFAGDIRGLVGRYGQSNSTTVLELYCMKMSIEETLRPTTAVKTIVLFTYLCKHFPTNRCRSSAVLAERTSRDSLISQATIQCQNIAWLLSPESTITHRAHLTFSSCPNPGRRIIRSPVSHITTFPT